MTMSSTIQATVELRNGEYRVEFATTEGGFALSDLDALIHAAKLAKRQLAELAETEQAAVTEAVPFAAVASFAPG